MVNEFQKGALATRLGIPMIYGIDAVHGNNNVYNATIFPHNVGLGATRQLSNNIHFIQCKRMAVCETTGFLNGRFVENKMIVLGCLPCN